MTMPAIAYKVIKPKKTIPAKSQSPEPLTDENKFKSSSIKVARYFLTHVCGSFF